jgi:formylglycine-generating enzyme required for sulfatase activity
MPKVTKLNQPPTGSPSRRRDAALRAFAFEVVTLDGQGREAERRRGRARQFTERLGNGVTLHMVRIPGGTFTMGAPESEAGSRRSERPQRRVAVPPFCLGKHPVTIAQWCAVMGAAPHRMIGMGKAFKASRRQPVVGVSCDDAEAFCRQLSQQTGRAYRLPSEAEWEYACRAGTSTPFWFGETITRDLANFDGKSTTPVGSLGVANGFGLFDMHGNVWEWCWDRWHADYQGAPLDGSAWTISEDQRTRVLRGGSWAHGVDFCRSAARMPVGEPKARSRKIGFRVAL